MWKRERVYVIMCVWERETESEFIFLERERERVSVYRCERGYMCVRDIERE